MDSPTTFFAQTPTHRPEPPAITEARAAYKAACEMLDAHLDMCDALGYDPDPEVRRKLSDREMEKYLALQQAKDAREAQLMTELGF